jgi:hypothetical protein
MSRRQPDTDLGSGFNLTASSSGRSRTSIVIPRQNSRVRVVSTLQTQYLLRNVGYGRKFVNVIKAMP